jgi:tetratricopeptide (TPR) repeat protein
MDDEVIDRFTGEGPLNTDDRPFLEHSAARCFGRETTPENLQALLQARGDPASYAALVTGYNGPEGRAALDRLTAARNEMIEGRIATYAGEFQAAIEHYQMALGIAPEDGMSRIFLDDAVLTLSARRANEGDEYRRQGLLDEAVEAYERALDLDPSQPRALNGIGLLLFNAGRYSEALDLFDRVLYRMPNQVQIRYNRVLALLKLGMVEEAEREISTIEELESEMNLRVSGELRKILLQVKHQTGKL